MTARHRPRQNFKTEEYTDEQQLWSTIVDKIKKCSTVSKRLLEVKTKIAAAEEAIQGEDSASNSLQKLDELEKLYREGVKLAEEEVKILNDEPDDLIKNLDTLISVRAAFEVETPQARAPPPSKRGNLKRTRHEVESVDSPAPLSEAATPGPTSRVVSKAASRSGSVAAASGKSEALSDNTEQGKTTVSTPEKIAKFAIDSEVFFRHPGEDGLGYLAKIVGITTEKGVRKYKVKDIDPELKDGPVTATADKLMAIPPEGTILPPLQKGREVYAVYPNTTTIYNARVVGMKKDMCRLVFENDDNQETDVKRHHVLEPNVS